MATTWNTTITNKGIELQTKQINGAKIAFTRVVSGSGSVPIVNLKEQTAVSDIQQTLSVESLDIKGNQYVITVLLTNNEVTTAYNLSQVGFYATDPDEGEILFAISQIDTAKQVPASADAPGYSIEFAFTFQNANNATIEITPNLAGYMTRGEIEKLVAENGGDAVELDADIVEEDGTTQKTGWLKKTIDNISTRIFAIAHVKNTYYDYASGTTLDEVLIETEDFDQTAVTESEISPAILSLINEVDTAQASNYTLLNNNKAESTDVYTKEEVDNLVENSSVAQEIYLENYMKLTKEEQNNGTLYCIPDATMTNSDGVLFAVENGILTAIYDDGTEEGSVE